MLSLPYSGWTMPKIEDYAKVSDDYLSDTNDIRAILRYIGYLQYILFGVAFDSDALRTLKKSTLDIIALLGYSAMKIDRKLSISMFFALVQSRFAKGKWERVISGYQSVLTTLEKSNDADHYNDFIFFRIYHNIEVMYAMVENHEMQKYWRNKREKRFSKYTDRIKKLLLIHPEFKDIIDQEHTELDTVTGQKDIFYIDDAFIGYYDSTRNNYDLYKTDSDDNIALNNLSLCISVRKIAPDTFELHEPSNEADSKLITIELNENTLKSVSNKKPRRKLSEKKNKETTTKDPNQETYNFSTKEVTTDKDSDPESSLGELNTLIGLNNLKKDISSLVRFVQMQEKRKAMGIKTVPISMHLVFSGNPGTGKTTVARILAKIYKEIGVLSKGHLVEVDRSDLVAGYVGQTAIKTKEKLDEAKGGILFIDEAYSLANSSEYDFGKEAIDTILKYMEDNRDDIVVIAAGYPDLMQKFISSNPGLKSRFNRFMTFEDYNEEELYQIFLGMCDKADYQMTEEAKDLIQEKIHDMVINKGDDFANARDVRNVFEKVIMNQANRTMVLNDPSQEDITTITGKDCENL